MVVHLAYGKQGMDIDIPERNLMKVLTMQGAPPIPDPAVELMRQLRQPTGSAPLGELAAKATSACVVICDVTRPVPNAVLLPPILEVLEQRGLRREEITILIATGLHRPSRTEELDAMVGPLIRQRYRVFDHHARAESEQRFLGLTARKTPVFIDKHYCDAGLKITTGFIEPHLMAGFSGGRKLVAPGCAGEQTIKALHSPVFLEDPECREGSIDKNPLHHELLDIARMAGHDFIVNVSLDMAHAITGVFAGDPLAAHARGIEHVRKSVRATVPGPADIVVTTSAGYPLDLTYYQAVKGITAALPVVRKGGLLIVAAECEEGLGSPEFTAMATRHRSAQAFLDTIFSSPVVIDQWQLEECAKAARGVEVILVSPNVAAKYRDELFIGTAATMDEALERGFRKLGPDASVAVIPAGPYTLVDTEARATPTP